MRRFSIHPGFYRRLLIKLILLFSWPLALSAQTEYINQLKSQLDTARTAEVRVAVLNKLCRAYNQHNADSLPYFANLMAEYDDPKKFPLVRRNIATSYGVYYFRRGNYDSSVYFFEKGIAFATEDGDTLGMAQSLSNAGAVYSITGQNEKALQSFLDALRIKQSLGPDYEKTLLSTLGNICGTYQNLKLFDQALQYALESVRIAIKFNEQPRLCDALENSGSLYMDLGKWDSAAVYLKKAFVLSKELNNALDAATSRRKLGMVLIKQGEEEKGVEHLKASIAYLEGTNFQLEKMRSYDALAAYYRDNKSYSRALSLYKKTLPIYQQMGNRREIAIVQYDMAQLLKKLGRYQEAFDLLDDHKLLQDSIFSQQTAEAISEIEIKYQTEKKEQELALQAAQLSQQELAIEQQQFVRNVSLAGALVLGIVALLIYWIKSRSNEQISQKNVQLNKALSEREALIKEIHHRVKNNLQIIASLLYLQSDEVENQTVKELLEQGQGRVRSMALIHQKLYENEDLKSIPFEEYLNELMAEIKNSFGPSAQPVQLDVKAPGVYFDVETAVPLGLIINELSTNAFKYAFNKQLGGVLKVHLNKSGQQYEMTVSDDGVGIPQEKIDSIDSKSLGLKLTRMLSDQLEGEYAFDTRNGTTFELKFSA